MIEINNKKYEHCGLCDDCLKQNKSLPCSGMIIVKKAK